MYTAHEYKQCTAAASVELNSLGCFAIWLQVKGAVITEDTCLCFNALNGLPGPYMYVQMNELSLLAVHHVCVDLFGLLFHLV